MVAGRTAGRGRSCGERLLRVSVDECVQAEDGGSCGAERGQGASEGKDDHRGQEGRSEDERSPIRNSPCPCHSSLERLAVSTFLYAPP